MPRKWFNAKEKEESIELDIYGPIGSYWWDDDATSAKQVLDLLNNAGDKPINIHVNSEGGSVFDGFAIYSQLKQAKGKVTAYVDGLAASAASYLIAAADEVVMSDVAWIMIHNASGWTGGDKSALRKEADVLENIDNTIASIYAKRSGQYSADYFLELMNEETWLDAEHARDYGMVDTIEEGLQAVAHLNLHNEKIFATAPARAREFFSHIENAKPHAKDHEPAPSDTLANLPTDEGSDAQEGTTEATQEQSRIVVLDNKIYEERL